MESVTELEEGQRLWVFENGRKLRFGMPFRVSHVKKDEVIGVDDDGNNRSFNLKQFTFAKS